MAARFYRSTTSHRLLILLACVVAGCGQSKPPVLDKLDRWEGVDVAKMSGPPELNALPGIRPVTSLESTDVLPHLEGPIIADRNYVYCATMKLLWDKLGGFPQADLKLVRAMTRLKFDQSDLDPDSFMVASGDRDAIETQIRERFPGAHIEFSTTSPPTVEKTCVYLQKSLPFRERYERRKAPLRFASLERDVDVASFGFEDFNEGGIQDSIRKAQVLIIDYHDASDFVIELKTMSKRDRLVLAKVIPSPTLEATVDDVQERVEQAYPLDSEKSEIQDGESLIIPNVVIGLSASIDELSLLQAIRLRLDEAGATLESHALYDGIGEGGGPRRFIFDRPFLIYLVERQSNRPYFAAWIANDELLERFAEAPADAER